MNLITPLELLAVTTEWFQDAIDWMKRLQNCYGAMIPIFCTVRVLHDQSSRETNHTRGAD